MIKAQLERVFPTDRERAFCGLDVHTATFYLAIANLVCAVIDVLSYTYPIAEGFETSGEAGVHWFLLLFALALLIASGGLIHGVKTTKPKFYKSFFVVRVAYSVFTRAGAFAPFQTLPHK
ncbi:hypothetical protein M3Y99_01774400 [Aphelenchoides fujianensis]|nr:hypothetical protein M3Y99_01774400 [Aphelenchoides fujianensis]